MKFTLLLISIIAGNIYAQDLRIKEIRRKPDPKIQNTTSASIIYPIIVLKNKTTSLLINEQIQKDFFSAENDKLNVEKLLTREIEEGLSDLDYEVTFKSNGILSLDLFAEGCGAYCSSWHTYFNFDLKTGKRITIEDLVREDQVSNFKTIVFQQKTDSLRKYLVDEKVYLERKEIDSADYDWISEQVTDCMKDVQISIFSLTKKGLEIIDPCDLPHAIQSQSPYYELKYSYTFLKPFLKKELQVKLK